jgi:hypothetical protein
MFNKLFKKKEKETLAGRSEAEMENKPRERGPVPGQRSSFTGGQRPSLSL